MKQSAFSLRALILEHDEVEVAWRLAVAGQQDGSEAAVLRRMVGDIQQNVPHDTLAHGMLAVMAQLQSDQLSEKMRDTRLAEARQGRLVGPVPVEYERRDGRLVPAPQAEALRLAFQMLCTDDYGATKITRAINDAGYRMPDGSPFKLTAVQEMLTNPVYAGFVTCAGQVFPEALISQHGSGLRRLSRHTAGGAHDPMRRTSRYLRG